VYDSETVQALPLFHFISAHAAGLKIETIEVVLQSDWNEIKKYSELGVVGKLLEMFWKSRKFIFF
jgi:hypothetical protein